MIDESDWRLQGQEKFIQGVVLVKRPYRSHPQNADRDHDHCELCWAKFMVEGNPDSLHEGYSTEDEYRWICKTCFTDFRVMFGWQVVVSNNLGEDV